MGLEPTWLGCRQCRIWGLTRAAKRFRSEERPQSRRRRRQRRRLHLKSFRSTSFSCILASCSFDLSTLDQIENAISVLTNAINKILQQMLIRTWSPWSFKYNEGLKVRLRTSRKFWRFNFFLLWHKILTTTLKRTTNTPSCVSCLDFVRKLFCLDWVGLFQPTRRSALSEV